MSIKSDPCLRETKSLRNIPEFPRYRLGRRGLQRSYCKCFYRITGNQVWRIRGTNGGNDSTSEESQQQQQNYFKEQKGNSGVET